MPVTNEKTIGAATPRKARRSVPVLTVILCATLVLYALALVVLMVWGFISSLKGNLDFNGNPFGLPEVWKFDNYVVALRLFFVKIQHGAGFRTVYIEEMFLNSILYALGCAAAHTMTCCITAYVTSKFRYKFSNVLYAVVIVTMVIPIVGSLPSEIQMAQLFGLYDRIWGLWVMKANFLGLYYLVFHATFRGLPKEFADAARVDGAGNFKIMTSIMIPLVAKTIGVIMLISFIGFWNDYQTPLIYMPSHPTIAYGLFSFSFSNANLTSSPPMKLVGCMIMMIPILIVFFALRNRLMGNLSMGGIKE